MRRPTILVLSHTKNVAGQHERGTASIQLVILMPALFTLLFVGMQAAMIYHGRTVAIAAAQEGARATAAQNGTSATHPPSSSSATMRSALRTSSAA